MKLKLLLILILILNIQQANGQDIADTILVVKPVVEGEKLREYLDLQMHPTMHMTYRFFGAGFEYFEEGKEPKESYKHMLKNTNYANYWEQNKGARIIVSGALNKEKVRKPKKARNKILAQIEYVNKFAEENPEQFVVAKTPDEVRELVATTKKTIILHSVEGARQLVNSQEDADFWAEQGVAFMTLIHLRDNELGTSAIKPGLLMKLLNLRGALKRKGKRGGLTPKGKQVISWLANAGIMTDITHMSDKAREDALEYMEAKGIPPISTHDLYRPIQNHPRGITREQILRIYKNKGFVSLPISGYSLVPHNPEEAYQNYIDTLSCYCENSMENYRITYQELKKHIESNYQEITGIEKAKISELTESEKELLSIGFQSDFNGWINHSRPKYGKKGCYEIDSTKTYERIETEGMSHPGLIDSHWKYLEREGVDLLPIKRNSERFVQLWEDFRSGKFMEKNK